MRVVVIGANAVGAKAASRIRRLNPDAEITMLEQERNFSYAGCGLPYFLAGEIVDIDELIRTPYGRARDAEYFKKVKNIDVRTRCRAETIDRQNKVVGVSIIADRDDDLSDLRVDLGEKHQISVSGLEYFTYDKLILATGSVPVIPPIEGACLKHVYHLTRMEDAAAIDRAIREKPGGKAVIIGSGFIGMEAVEALAAREWEVTVLERQDQLFPLALDFEIAAVVQERLFEKMIEYELNAEVLKIENKRKDGGLVVATREERYDADLVILATGVRPNVAIARAAGLEIGETGALAVDEYLRTSDPDIFAGGDLVENLHLVSRKKRYLPMGSTANKHGRVIGDNVCGMETRFPGVQGTFICKVFDFSVGSTGLSEIAAAEVGFDARSLCAPGFDKAHYYPGRSMLGLKFVYEKGSGRLLGLQAVGRGDVARRIDVAAAAIRFGATIDEVADLDLCYAPPYAQALDCLIAGANAARNVEANILLPVDAARARSILRERDDVLMLDVRSAGEFAQGHVDDEKVLNIPLDELSARMGEIPRGKKILCICVSAQRGYSAQRLLEAAGFRDVSTVAGGMFLWPWKEELT